MKKNDSSPVVSLFGIVQSQLDPVMDKVIVALTEKRLLLHPKDEEDYLILVGDCDDLHVEVDGILFEARITIRGPQKTTITTEFRDSMMVYFRNLGVKDRPLHSS